jgi:hypothetical protein
VLLVAAILWTASIGVTGFAAGFPLWLIFFRNDPAQSTFVGDAELKHIRDGVEAYRDRTPGHVRHGFTDWRLLLTADRGRG